VDEIHRGDLIIFKIPERAEKLVRDRRYVGDSIKYMIKRVGAMPGDIVTVKDLILYVNDTAWGFVFDRDGKGYPMPQLNLVDLDVGEGELLPLAEAMKSFDGRYYGKIKQSDVLWKAKFIFGF
jgi:type IV secretory pathway protease TraF